MTKPRLKKITQLRHRPNRRPRRLNRIRLLNRNRWPYILYRIYIRPIHNLKKLPRIRTKRLHIPPLPLRMQCLKYQRRFPTSTEPRNHRQLPKRYIQVKPLKIILPHPP